MFVLGLPWVARLIGIQLREFQAAEPCGLLAPYVLVRFFRCTCNSPALHPQGLRDRSECKSRFCQWTPGKRRTRLLRPRPYPLMSFPPSSQFGNRLLNRPGPVYRLISCPPVQAQACLSQSIQQEVAPPVNGGGQVCHCISQTRLLPFGCERSGKGQPGLGRQATLIMPTVPLSLVSCP